MIVSYKEALNLIQSQDIVVVPTETVYGLAGDATSPTALRKIYDAKKRPHDNPLIVHVNSLEEAMKYGRFSEDAIKIAQQFWPGPLTIVVKKLDSEISQLVTGGKDTIAIRVPDNKIIRQLIQDSGKPIAAPSANMFTRLSTTTAQDADIGFDGLVPVLAGDKCTYGIESTIIDCSASGVLDDSESAIKILRHGFITQEILSDLLGREVGEDTHSNKAPGSYLKHYSPQTKMNINRLSASENEFAINFGGSDIGGAESLNLSPKGDLLEAARNLYDTLSKADNISRQKGIESIAVAVIPQTGIGLAINDKLTRGSYQIHS